MSKLYTRATNPKQYDEFDIDWVNKGAVHPVRKFHFHYYLFKYLKNLKDKSCLDVGSGTGLLVEDLVNHGAEKAIGIEPSSNNLRIARKLFPNRRFVSSSFEDFHSKERFDIITAVMVLEHIKDLGMAFKKVKFLLNEKGKLYIFVGDLDYWKKPKFDYEIKTEKVNKNETVVAITREWGFVVDILRSPDYYVKMAESAGLKLVRHIPLKYSRKLAEVVPKYKSVLGQVTGHLIIFEKP